MSKIDTNIQLTYGGSRGTAVQLKSVINGSEQPVGELYLYEQYRAALKRVEELSAELERARQTAVVYDWRLTK